MEEERRRSSATMSRLEEKMSDMEVQTASLEARLAQRQVQLTDLQRDVSEREAHIITLEREVSKTPLLVGGGGWTHFFENCFVWKNKENGQFHST